MKSRDYLLKFFFFTGAILMLFALCANAQDPSLVAKWSFDGNSGRTARDSVKGVDDMIEGQVKYVAGVTGNGLRFDGYTTTVLRMADKAPKLANAFTVGAWGALNTYPWNWVPIVDQEEFKQVGFLFGIDAFGHLGLQVSVDRVWRTVVSSCHLPLKKWVHVVGTFDGSSGLTIYIDGKEVGKLAVRGHLSPAERTDLLIGRIRVPDFRYWPVGAWAPRSCREPASLLPRRRPVRRHRRRQSKPAEGFTWNAAPPMQFPSSFGERRAPPSQGAPAGVKPLTATIAPLGISARRFVRASDIDTFCLLPSSQRPSNCGARRSKKARMNGS